MSKIPLSLIVIFCFSCSGLLDEKSPAKPINLVGYFTMSENTPRVNISWNSPSDDDVSEYQIFKSIDQGTTFEMVGKVGGNLFDYEDTSTIWLDNIYYKVRAKDNYDNIGEFSDSMFVTCYKPGGNWKVVGLDSIYLCVDPGTYSTPEVFRLELQMPLDSLGDTAAVMDFTEISVDTFQFSGSGWMYYTYLVVEMSQDSLFMDTVTYANTVAPEFCTMDLSDPSTGKITFDSGMYEDILLVHDLTSCQGDSLFP